MEMTIFDCAFALLTQLTQLIVPILGIYILFDLTGSLLLGK